MTANPTTRFGLFGLLPTAPRARAEPARAPLPVLAAQGASIPRHLLPRTLREALARWAGRRAMAQALARLADTSPHLLRDIGVDADGLPTQGDVAPAVSGRPWLLPSLHPDTPPGASGQHAAWRFAGLPSRPEVRPRDDGIPSTTLGWRAGRPTWTAPDHWLR